MLCLAIPIPHLLTRQIWGTSLTGPGEELPQRVAAMADQGLLVWREFGKALAQRRKIEERVIAETQAAARGAQDYACGFAAKVCDLAAIARGGDDADKSRSAFGFGNRFQLAQELGIVGRIGAVSSVLGALSVLIGAA